MQEKCCKLNNLGLLILRVLMGSGIAYHGFGKIFGGGMAGFTQAVASMGFPMPELFAWAAALSEFVGGLLLVFGLLTRVAAFLIFSTMFVAVFITHAADPLAIKELALGYLTIALALMCTGPGDFSLDKSICQTRT